MHAFLIVGKGELVDIKAQEIAQENKAKLENYELKKIEDVRNLGKTTKLSLDPTAYFIKNIDGATEEALNAFLKELEEPQENLYYILTTSNLNKVLPTITSRCQVISLIHSQFVPTSKETQEFIKMKVGQRLAFVDKIRDRGEAIKFIEEFIETEHLALHEAENLTETSENIKVATTSLNNLKANGNVALQLANFVVNLV